MLVIAVAAAFGFGQPAMGTYARHPASTTFRPCSGKLGEKYSYLDRLSGAFGYSATFFLGCLDGAHAPWILVAGLDCRSNEESFCTNTKQSGAFTSFKDILEPNYNINYRFVKYSLGENCSLDHDAGNVWMCKNWSSRQDARGATITTLGGEMILDDDWSFDDRTDARDFDYTLSLGTPPE